MQKVVILETFTRSTGTSWMYMLTNVKIYFLVVLAITSGKTEKIFSQWASCQNRTLFFCLSYINNSLNKLLTVQIYNCINSSLPFPAS